MSQLVTCGGCGEPLADGSTICRSCGWDLTTTISRPPRPSILAVLRSGAWRVILYGGIAALVLVGFARFRATGTAPDLATTLRWMAFGDDGRAAELVTIHRAHEIASAAARYAVHELEPPPIDDDWEPVLAPYATMWVRGWMPLLFYGATTDMAPRSVQEIFTVQADDGWGRPYRLEGRQLARDGAWPEDPQVAADLEAGLQTSFFGISNPVFDPETDWMRLEISSAGGDGTFDNGDDLRLVSYFPVGFTLHISRRPQELQKRLDRLYTQGRHHFRLEGNRRGDLIDARLLAEHRIVYLP
jgi:hypothetical protein